MWTGGVHSLGRKASDDDVGDDERSGDKLRCIGARSFPRRHKCSAVKNSLSLTGITIQTCIVPKLHYVNDLFLIEKNSSFEVFNLR